MLVSRQLLRHTRPALFICLSLWLTSCAVCTVNKCVLEEKLSKKSEHPNYKGISMNAVKLVRKGKSYNNNIDTLLCEDAVGKAKMKKFSYSSKVRIITKRDESVRVYAKTLYIWNDEFLVGERVTPGLTGGPSYFPVRIEDIARIEVKP